MAKSVKLRKAEFVPTASFLLVSFERDQQELEDRFSELSAEFLQAFKTQRDKVDQLESTLGLTEEQKGVTRELYLEVDELNEELDYVSYYFKESGMDTKIISKIKALLHSGDVEGATESLTGLVQYLELHTQVLQQKGMKAAFPATLGATRLELMKKNTEQNTVMNTINTLYEKNAAEYDALYEYVSKVTRAGKIRYSKASKIREYTTSKIVSRMRRGGGIEQAETV